MMLCDKYQPTTLNSVIGNSSSISKLLQFGYNIQKGEVVKPIIIYGPPGTGKTSAVKALASSNGFDLLELNSADYLDSESLNKLLTRSNRSNALFNSKMLILLDEIDEIPKKENKSVEKIILEVMKKSIHPIILIANDYWSRNIAFLRGYTEKCEFKKIPSEDIAKLLMNILEKEKKIVDNSIITNLSIRCNGDVRGAINDLEMVIDTNPEIIEYLGIRSKKLEIFGVLDKIFLSRNFDIARNGAFNADVDLGMLINWVEENIQNRYLDKRSISDAFESIATASMFFEKASRKNYYDYFKYASVHASAGVAIANSGQYSMLKQYSFPKGIERLSKNKKEREIANRIATKLVYSLHIHKKDVKDYTELFKIIIAKASEVYGIEKVYEFMELKFNLDNLEVDSIA
jgi:replication factor C large subunit